MLLLFFKNICCCCCCCDARVSRSDPSPPRLSQAVNPEQMSLIWYCYHHQQYWWWWWFLIEILWWHHCSALYSVRVVADGYNEDGVDGILMKTSDWDSFQWCCWCCWCWWQSIWCDETGGKARVSWVSSAIRFLRLLNSDTDANHGSWCHWCSYEIGRPYNNDDYNDGW